MSSADVPDCKEANVILPGNTNLLCWFDSANFALFHKRRPELDEYFKTHTTEETDILIKQLYDHYSGEKKDIGNIQQFQEDFRNNTKIQELFKKEEKTEGYSLKNTIKKKPDQYTYLEGPTATKPKIITIKDGLTEKELAKEGAGGKNLKYILKEESDKTYIYEKGIDEKITINGTEETRTLTYTFKFTEDEFKNNFVPFVAEYKGFEISGSVTRDPSEYLDTFYDLIFNKAYEKSSTSDTVGNSVFTFKPFFDIRLGLIPYTLESPIIDPIPKLLDSCTTFFVDVLEVGKPMNYKEKIKVPLYKNKSSEPSKTVLEKVSEGIFILDALVIHTGGNHYYSVVRCGDTDTWLLYDDLYINKLNLKPSICSLKDLQEKLTTLLTEKEKEKATKSGNAGIVASLDDEIKDIKKYIENSKPIKGFETMRNTLQNNTHAKILLYSRPKE